MTEREERKRKGQGWLEENTEAVEDQEREGQGGWETGNGKAGRMRGKKERLAEARGGEGEGCVEGESLGSTRKETLETRRPLVTPLYFFFASGGLHQPRERGGGLGTWDWGLCTDCQQPPVSAPRRRDPPSRTQAIHAAQLYSSRALLVHAAPKPSLPPAA